MLYKLSPKSFRYIRSNDKNLPSEETIQRFINEKFKDYVGDGILVSDDPTEILDQIVKIR